MYKVYILLIVKHSIFLYVQHQKHPCIISHLYPTWQHYFRLLSSLILSILRLYIIHNKYVLL